MAMTAGACWVGNFDAELGFIVSNEYYDASQFPSSRDAVLEMRYLTTLTSVCLNQVVTEFPIQKLRNNRMEENWLRNPNPCNLQCSAPTDTDCQQPAYHPSFTHINMTW